MKKNNLLLLPLFVVVVIAAGYMYRIYGAQKTTGTIAQIQSERENPQILFPKAGGTLYKGHTYNIQWTGGGTGEALFLQSADLEKEGQSVSIVDRVYDIPNTSNIQYTVPSEIPDGIYTISIAGLTSGKFQIITQD